MKSSTDKIEIYIEAGSKKAFAGAIEWPGWVLSGRDEEAAIQTLLAYGPRYGEVLHSAGIVFSAPIQVSEFIVVDRLEGNATTDFGAPDRAPAADARPVDKTELQRMQEILAACWQGLDEAAWAAAGKELRKGPRGGGRDPAGILEHVLGAEMGYLSKLGWKLEKKPDVSNAAGSTSTPASLRQAILDGLAASARGEIPERGPRGGFRWSPRYYTRRAAWHILDHIWEIENRIL